MIVALALCALSPVACGGEDERSTPASRPLSARDDARVDESRLAIRAYCRRVARFLGREAGPPAAADTQRAYDAVDRLIALARENPEARYRGQDTLRQVLGDIAEDLEGTNCSSALVDRIERGLALLPSS